MRISLFGEEQKLFDATDNFYPSKDIQDYIRDKSIYQSNEELSKLYKVNITQEINIEPKILKSVSVKPPQEEEDLNLDTSDDEDAINDVTKITKSVSMMPSETVPDQETKKVLGNVPKLLESMSIADLPIEAKRKYQFHVNKLKSIREFLTEAFTNFTLIHTKYKFLEEELTSSMFSQLNHEAFTSITYIFIDLYYCFFEGSETFIQSYLESLPIKPSLRKAAQKITKKKASLLKQQKDTLRIMDLIHYILNYFTKKITKNKDISEPEFTIYEQLMCVLWNSIFYIKLRQSNYNEKTFERELLQFVSLSKLNELTDEDGQSIDSVELIDITKNALVNLGEPFNLPFPLNYYFFAKLSRNLFNSDSVKKDTVVTEAELSDLGNNLFAFMDDILNIKPPYDYVIWINIIFEYYLSDQKDYTTDKNNEAYAYLTIVSVLLKKLSSHKSKILKSRLISVDLLHVYQVPIDTELDFSFPNLIKLLQRLENATILLPTLRITKDLLTDYKNNFENNVSILRLILNIFK